MKEKKLSNIKVTFTFYLFLCEEKGIFVLLISIIMLVDIR